MARVVITGATGTIGAAVCRALLERGDEVVALSRDPTRAEEKLGDQVEARAWPDPTGSPPPAAALAGADGVIHLLGEPIAQRWSPEAKARIRDSRVLATRMLVAGLRDLPPDSRPAVLVSQSATGYYGPSGDRELAETAPPGDDFLAQVVVAWEAAADDADELLRVVTTRTGVVLSPAGGALAQMLPFFRLGLGGPVAGGDQYVPWIHLEDVVGGILFALDEAQARGPLNLVAPTPVTNRELSRALGHALHRPAVLPVPGFALKLLYGEMASVVTTGQRAIPAQLHALRFEFVHPEIEPALRDVLSRAGPSG